MLLGMLCASRAMRAQVGEGKDLLPRTVPQTHAGGIQQAVEDLCVMRALSAPWANNGAPVCGDLATEEDLRRYSSYAGCMGCEPLYMCAAWLTSIREAAVSKVAKFSV
jgi:hypothetical protein